MGYRRVMSVFLLSLALAASTPSKATVVQVAPGAVRRASGAEASATVSVRILHAPALIGSAYGPPAPNMQPRSTQIEAADRTMVDAIIYDFE